MRDSFICGICGKQNEIDDPVKIDHIIPKSKLPNSHPWNLQSSCENCNMEKSNRLLLDTIPIMLEGVKFRSEKNLINSGILSRFLPPLILIIKLNLHSKSNFTR